MLSSFYNYEATFTKTAIKLNSLHVEIPRYFCETSLAKSISRESVDKDYHSIKSESNCDVIVTWYADQEKNNV